jgi:hypothetical protein
MAVLLMLGLLAVFGGVWLVFAALWLVFRIGFWFLGSLLGLMMAGVGLFVCSILALVLLPVAGLLMLPFLIPALLLGGLVWLIFGSARPAPIIIRR